MDKGLSGLKDRCRTIGTLLNRTFGKNKDRLSEQRDSDSELLALINPLREKFGNGRLCLQDAKIIDFINKSDKFPEAIKRKYGVDRTLNTAKN